MRVICARFRVFPVRLDRPGATSNNTSTPSSSARFSFQVVTWVIFGRLERGYIKSRGVVRQREMSHDQ